MSRRIRRPPSRRGQRNSTRPVRAARARRDRTRHQSAPRRLPGRELVSAFGVVLLTVAALVVAGTTPRPTGVHRPTTRTATLGRDLSCAGGVPGAVGRVGRAGHLGAARSGTTTVRGKPATRRSFRLGSRPARVQISSRGAAHAYGVRYASTAHWLAAGACPSPRPDWWFVGVGGSINHDSVLTLDNPRPGASVVDIDVLGPDGPVQAPGLRGLRIGSFQSLHLDLTKVAPSVGDLAVHVSASRGLVAASAAEVWSSDFASLKAHGWVTAQPGVRRNSILVGLATRPQHATVLIANPTTTEAVVDLEFVGVHGAFTPTRHPSVRVPPATVLTVDLGAIDKARPMAVLLRSQVPVTATVRTTRGTDETYAGVATPVGAGAVVGLPVRIPARLVLVGGDAGGRATVTGYDASGSAVGTRDVDLSSRGAVSTAIWPRAVALRVTTDRGRLTGAVVLGKPDGRTVATIPLSATSSDTRVPAVRPGW